jgi:predicted porin
LFLLAAGSGAAYAQSSVTLYGQVDSFVGFSKPAGAASTAYVVGSGDIQTSYWGIKGTEDLGAGLQAIFNLNGYFRANNGQAGASPGSGVFDRDAYVGLQSAIYGSVRLGRNITPFFYSTALFNPLVDSYGYSPMIQQTYLSMTGRGGVFDPGLIGDASWNSSVLYTTPNIAGLSASLIYEFGGQPGAAGQNKWGGNLLYANGPFAATVAFQQVRFNEMPGDVTSPAALTGFGEQAAVQGGMSYDLTFARFFVQAGYVHTVVSNTMGNVRHQNVQVGARLWRAALILGHTLAADF